MEKGQHAECDTGVSDVDSRVRVFTRLTVLLRIECTVKVTREPGSGSQRATSHGYLGRGIAGERRCSVRALRKEVLCAEWWLWNAESRGDGWKESGHLETLHTYSGHIRVSLWGWEDLGQRVS